MVLFWLSLAFLVLVTIASSVFLTLRVLDAFRAFKHLGNLLEDGLSAVAQSSSEIERHLERATASGSELDASLGRLRRSRAVFAVLTSAIADVRASAGRITAFVPRSK